MREQFEKLHKAYDKEGWGSPAYLKAQKAITKDQARSQYLEDGGFYQTIKEQLEKDPQFTAEDISEVLLWEHCHVCIRNYFGEHCHVSFRNNPKEFVVFPSEQFLLATLAANKICGVWFT